MPKDIPSAIRNRFARHGIDASQPQVSELSAYIGHLAKWNKTINLTSLDLEEQLDESLDRMVIEPFIAGSILSSERHGGSELRILDLGSGGGSPGIPLAIALQSTRLMLVESKVRKAAFLRDVLRELDWSDATVSQLRIDDLASDRALLGSVDVLSVRAVRMGHDEWTTASLLLAPGGRAVWFRSALVDVNPDAVGLEVLNRHRLPSEGDEVAVLGARSQ